MESTPLAQRMTVTVADRTPLTADIVQLTLALPVGEKFPEWEPGAHIDIDLPSGLRRQYSLCGDPTELETYKIAVLREPGGRGGSVELHRSLVEGASAEIQGPRNLFHLVPAEAYVFVAGGIGITPIRTMVQEAEGRGVPWSLYYGGRDLPSMAFGAELQARYPGNVTLVPQDTHGFIGIDGLVEGLQPGTELYCCGPAAMLEVVEASCEAHGKLEQFHFERFAPVAPAPTLSDDEMPFDLEMRESGVTVRIGADESILEAVRKIRGDVDFSCQEGYCGSCESRVLEGQPDHRGTLMSDEDHDEEGTMLICVGRSLSPKLVLDL